MTITTKQLVRTIKKAADLLVEQDKTINTHTKASSVDEIVRSMADKGYIAEGSIEAKKAELMDESNLEVYRKVLSQIGGNPVDIASPEKMAGVGDPVDNFVYGL